MKKQLLILMALFIAVKSYSQTVGDTFFENSITYEITSLTPNEVKTIGYVVSGGPVVSVPATVVNGGNTYNVTTIGTQTFASKNLTSLTLPSGIIDIEDTAFTNNALTSITIPNSVVTIGYAAFGVNALTSVVIPDSVTSLGDSGFDSNALTSVTISNGLTSLGLATFANNNLSAITIPSNITTIGANVFSNNPLTCIISEATTPPTISSGSTTDSFGTRSNMDLTIPSGTANDYATAQWTGFNSIAEGLTGTFIVDNITYQINTSNEVTVTGYNAAGGMVVNIPATVSRACTIYNVTEIGNSVFANYGLTSLTLPNTIETIGIQSFGLNSLTEIVIPSSVTAIGQGAFAANNLMTDVYSESMIPPTITTNASTSTDSFGNRSNVHLHIPPGTTGAYVTDMGAQWTGFNPVTEDATLSTSDFELANNIKVITKTDAINVISPDSVRLQNYIIYSISGAKVATGNESEISTASFSKGIYILKLDFDKGTITKKVLVN